MRNSKDELSVLLEAPGATVRAARWGGMVAAYAQYARGTDLTPALKGLKGDMCQCPHWGYVLKGALRLRYADGREELVRAGELWHAEPGHTARCEEDTEFVDFSPEAEFDAVVEHVRRQLES